MPKPALLSALLTSVAIVGCGGAKTETEKIVLYIGYPSPASVTKHIGVRKLPGVGEVLVDGKGYALYAFVPEKAGTSCTGACAAAWPLFRLLPANTLDTAGAMSETLITIGHAPEGGRMVGFSGWFLHNYSGDTTPLSTKGQGVSAYGGHWYLVTPTGSLVTSGA